MGAAAAYTFPLGGTVNPDDAILRAISDGNSAKLDMEFSVASVVIPEPGDLFLLFTGLAGVALAGRRRGPAQP